MRIDCIFIIITYTSKLGCSILFVVVMLIVNYCSWEFMGDHFLIFL